MFPVDAILPGLAASLAANRTAVLQAPPGTGKTTRVAPSLLDAAWLKGRKILLLEPRRLAARAAAAFMARQRGEAVGDTIGYHIRLERRVGPRTRVELLTEGLLTQRLLHDPELADAGLVIFDEFHERSLAADTALALTLDTRRALRPDLRLVVMSATLRPEAIAAHLRDADIHTADARLYPVQTRLLERLSAASLPQQAAGAVLRALREEPGSVLLFLPGEGEIRRTLELLRGSDLPPEVSLHPLYGALPREEQDAAVAPPAPGRRKIVLATSIAETSLTIEGIRVVIDTGWMRVPRFSPRNGMSRLETLRITRDRADQRRGRAGRLGPGVCYRLWDEATDHQLAPEALPEILDADLAATVLQSADWGTSARDGLPWFTPPPDAAWRQAVGLLQELGALAPAISRPAASGSDTAEPPAPAITARGRAMAALPAHPRLAHMIFEAARDGAAQKACLLAAVFTEAASESSVRYETDVRRLLDRVHEGGRDGFSYRVHELARRWGRGYAATDSRRLSEGLLLAWAFPDRLARRRDAEGRYLLRNGRGAVLDTADPLARAEWLVAAELLDEATDAKIRLAAPLAEDEVEAAFSDQMERRALPEQAWPDLSDGALLADLDTWLGPFCDGVTRWSHVDALDLTAILLRRLEACGCSRRALDTLAPTHLPVPSGSNIQVRYDRDPPYMEVRIQEVFGLTRTPAVAGGRVPVVLHLLSPAQRPVQVTRDLESFWTTGYALVRKDLRGRYPKHDWPEDPHEAKPTHRVRPRPRP